MQKGTRCNDATKAMLTVFFMVVLPLSIFQRSPSFRKTGKPRIFSAFLNGWGPLGLVRARDQEIHGVPK